MRFISPLRALALTAGALLCLPAFPTLAADNTARLVALDSAKVEAARLLEQNEAAKAYELYLRLLREEPDDDAINLGLARAATRIGRFDLAVIAYETLLEKYPKTAWLYNELTHVYLLLGDGESARRSAAVVRSLGDEQEESVRALDALEARYSLFQVHGVLRGGVYHDSNANLGPRSDTLDLGNWQVTVKDAKARESVGVYLGADVDFARRFALNSPWHVVGDVRVFWRGNENNELSRLNNRTSQWGRAALGLRHMTVTTLTEGRLKAEIFDYDFYQHVSSIGPEATFLWAATPAAHLIVRGGIDQRKYSLISERNGAYGWAGGYGRFFFGAANHEFLAGGRYLHAATDADTYDYDGWEATARFSFKLPYRLELTPFAAYTVERYKGPATILEAEDRRDTRLRLGSGLTWHINKSWSVELNYQYSKNASTSDLYDYRQHYASAGVAFGF
ncbi:MAG: tetratricopeptide repeat protein [Zoogloeaceae bacterium]|jgi:opacity protein-like surface antigen|nr:tetratricopeptide repeat protein [Zoogloeaceae bacterium]